MLKKATTKLKKLFTSNKSDYISYCSLPVDKNLVLLEGGQGANINGNVFAMLKELCENSAWQNFTPVLVVTSDSQQKASERIAFYNFKNVKLTLRDSRDYQKYLATAGYLLTDNTFPPYFNKRQGQVYLNTWHGTPLKTLGKRNKESLASLGNVQKNFLMCDYALFPNEFTKSVFMEDYDLASLKNIKCFVGNYPRNSVFYDAQKGALLKEKMGYGNKTVYAYMPTWRDTQTKAGQRHQIEITEKILREFDEKLPENSVLLVNLHFLLSSGIDCSHYKKIKYFPPLYETYEILNACDGLITDYSSVFFDYAVTGKNIILFAYDKEKYLSGRGTYMSFEELPFPVVKTVDEVVALMGTEISVPKEFIEEYCSAGCTDTCGKVFSLMVTGESDYYNVTCGDAPDNTCLIYCGTLKSADLYALKAYCDNNPEYKYILAYRKALAPSVKKSLDEIVGDISLYGILTAYQFTSSQLRAYIAARLFGNFGSKRMREFYKREFSRNFYGIKPSKAVDFVCNNPLISGMLSLFGCPKERVSHSRFFVTSGNKNAIKSENEAQFKEYDNSLAEENAVLSQSDNDKKRLVMSEFVFLNNKLPFYYNMGSKLRMVSFYSLRTPVKINTEDLYITIADKKYSPVFYGKKKASCNHKGILSLTVPVDEVVCNPKDSAVSICFDYEGGSVSKRFKYFSPIGSTFLGLKGPMNYHKQSNTVALFRQTEKGNLLMLYVRSRNVTDRLTEKLKQTVAFLISLVWKTKNAKKIVLLYEKNSSKYEESASVVYEYLCDNGYSNAYFICDKAYEYFDKIPEKYRKNIIPKYSFKHYLYYFTSRTFIGTEAIAHAFDLRTCNFLPLFKQIQKNINYVFLQHGVMYMVSLDSESRNMFRRKNLKGKYRVVCSSEAEKTHFTTLGDHYDNDMYVCGLPKYDKNTLDDNADKIVIMPTWRPWEINVARSEFKNTPYYKMLMKIYNSVPDDLKEKVVLLPHPLVANELSLSSPEFTGNIVLNARYDEILKTAKILITDYSSIAYDAFYRGSNVIFYWEEKDYCMAQYGPSTKLMLNESNVYGDYYYSHEGLTAGILKNYNNPQEKLYKERYKKLVQFHDGKNTARLIEFLKKDGII